MHLPRTALAAALLASLTACSSGGTDSVNTLPTTPSSVTSGAVPSSTITPSPPAVITVPGTPAPTTKTLPPATDAPEDPLTPRPPLETAPPTGQPVCDAKDLVVTDADALIDKTSVRELFVVRTSGPDCELTGYPTVALLDGTGKALSATYGHGGFGLPAEKPAVHTLSKDTSISFVVASARNGASCVTAAAARVRLPGTSAALTATTALSVCDKAVGLSPIRRQLDIE